MKEWKLNPLGNLAGSATDNANNAAADEQMVSDVRASLRPAELVERKLMHLLRSAAMPISHFSTAFRKR